MYVFLLGYVANGWEFRLIPYPDQIARHIVLFVSLYFFLQFVNEKNRVYLLTSILAASLLTLIHLFSWVHFLLAVGAFGVLSLPFLSTDYFKNSVKVILGTLLVSAPILILKLQNASSIVGIISLKKNAIVFTDKIFVVDPLSKGPIFILSSVLLVYLIFVFRKSIKNRVWLIFLASSYLAGAFIMFNPVLAPVTSKIISYTYMNRLGNLAYRELIMASFIFFVILSFKEKYKIDNVLKTIVIIVILSMGLLIPLQFAPRNKTDKFVDNTRVLTDYINSDLEKNSVYASDLWTSYNIPAFTNNYIIATYPTHMTSNVHKPERIEDLKTIYSKTASIEMTSELLDKYDVSYIVVINKPKKNDILMDQKKFVGKDEFREVYSDNNYKIYSYEKDEVK